jgi:hypothetical protein
MLDKDTWKLIQKEIQKMSTPWKIIWLPNKCFSLKTEW